MKQLTDSFSRRINYLRLSVTDRCQNRCLYCMPPDGIELFSHDIILTLEEISSLVKHFAACGVSSVRLTGGEPLLRRGLAKLVGMISEIDGIEDISLTTNGLLLARQIDDLAAAGLQRINVSLDTLVPQKFDTLCRGGQLAEVLDGLTAARKVVPGPIKLNTVVIGGVNDDELIDLVDYSLESGFTARFIELMPIGLTGFWSPDKFVPAARILDILSAKFDLEPTTETLGSGPAGYYTVGANEQDRIGVISSLSHPFCEQCNRVRLSSTGRLQPCLSSPKSIDLAAALRLDATTEEMIKLISDALATKPDRHCMSDHDAIHGENMSKIGG